MVQSSAEIEFRLAGLDLLEREVSAFAPLSSRRAKAACTGWRFHAAWAIGSESKNWQLHRPKPKSNATHRPLVERRIAKDVNGLP
ncbi:hypothetical protein [Rosistilla carotiformis]|uniref:hypothetical protein n=1 Tax=Rosistilla carotiformis TaxID=2528017 RepID=UPI0011A9810F|nr:hypothetical protein [Rosistilla carotiformis]